jgi:hypothetical protein
MMMNSIPVVTIRIQLVLNFREHFMEKHVMHTICQPSALTPSMQARGDRPQQASARNNYNTEGDMCGDIDVIAFEIKNPLCSASLLGRLPFGRPGGCSLCTQKF